MLQLEGIEPSGRLSQRLVKQTIGTAFRSSKVTWRASTSIPHSFVLGECSSSDSDYDPVRLKTETLVISHGQPLDVSCVGVCQVFGLWIFLSLTLPMSPSLWNVVSTRTDICAQCPKIIRNCVDSIEQ